MVVSFKISKKRTRYSPKPKPAAATSVPELSDDEVDAPAQLPKIQSPTARKRSVDFTEDDDNVAENLGTEVSFILNIFPDGYSIVNPSENNVGHQNAVQNDPKFLHPYDRSSESLMIAIECGLLPVNFLDGIHCKYINGTVVCEVRDYRKESSESGIDDSFTAGYPSIKKVSLKMSLDNVVNDIHLIADNTWEYGDLIEAEARILYALNPKLYLDPTPNLDRLCREPTSTKLNLDIRGKRLKRLRQMSAPENSNVRVGESRRVTGRPDFVNLVGQNVDQSKVIASGPKNHAPVSPVLSVSHQLRQMSEPENSYFRVGDSRPIMGQPDFVNLVNQNVGQSNMMATGAKNHAPENSKLRVGDLRSITGQPDLVNLVDQNVGQTNMVATGPKSHGPENSNLRVGGSRQITGQPDFVNLVDQNVGQSTKNHARDTTISSVSHLSSYQIGVGNSQHMQNHAHDINSSSIMSSVIGKRGNQDCQVSSMVNLNKRGKSTHVGLDGNQCMDNINARDSRLKHSQVQQPSKIQQMIDGIFNQYNVKKEPVETEKIDKFEPNQMHQRVSQQFNRSNFHKAPWNMSPNLENNTVKKEFSSGSMGLQFGAGVTSVPVVGGTRSLTFNANKSIQQGQMEANWRSNSRPMTHVLNRAGSSSSVGNRIGPFTASSPIDKSTRDRFSKIKMLTARFKLNSKKNKIDDYKPTIIFPTQQLKHLLFNDHDNDILKDEKCKMPLSKSLVGDNMNICKTRVLNFVQNERLLPGNGFLVIPKFHTRLILSERQSDGTVAMHYGELDDCDYLAEDELLPTLPNTHTADLLAAQFCSLMLREGYHLAGDHLKPKPISMVQSTGGQPNTTSGVFNNHGFIKQILESVPSQSTVEVVKPSFGGTSHHNMHLQSRGLFPRMHTSNQLSKLNAMGQNSNMQQQLGYSMVNNNNNNNRMSQFQNQLLQQQEQSQFQRKMMMGPGGMGRSIGGNNNSTVGIQNLGMGGGARAGTGVVSPLIGQNPNQGSSINSAISQQPLRSVSLTPTHAAATVANRQRMGQSRLVGQSINIGGLQGANRQTHLGSGSGSGSSGISMLGSGINRVNDMNLMQRNVMAPPKLLSGLNQNQNRYMNQQWLSLVKQEPTSHLHAVLSPPQQVGSPSPSIGMQHQQVGPHQQTPVGPQISSGAIQPTMSAGNQERSSQTMDDILM